MFVFCCVFQLLLVIIYLRQVQHAITNHETVDTQFAVVQESERSQSRISTSHCRKWFHCCFLLPACRPYNINRYCGILIIIFNRRKTSRYPNLNSTKSFWKKSYRNSIGKSLSTLPCKYGYCVCVCGCYTTNLLQSTTILVG